MLWRIWGLIDLTWARYPLCQFVLWVLRLPVPPFPGYGLRCRLSHCVREEPMCLIHQSEMTGLFVALHILTFAISFPTPEHGTSLLIVPGLLMDFWLTSVCSRDDGDLPIKVWYIVNTEIALGREQLAQDREDPHGYAKSWWSRLYL